MHYRAEIGDASKTEAHKWLVEGAKRNSSEAQCAEPRLDLSAILVHTWAVIHSAAAQV